MLALNDISTHSENEAFVDNICLMDGWRTRLPRLIDPQLGSSWRPKGSIPLKKKEGIL